MGLFSSIGKVADAVVKPIQELSNVATDGISIAADYTRYNKARLAKTERDDCIALVAENRAAIELAKEDDKFAAAFAEIEADFPE